MILTARAPDETTFAPFGAILRPPAVGGRSMFSDWLEPVAGLSAHYHLNRVVPSTAPVIVDRVERHPHSAQLFLPVGVTRYLVTVMPADETGAPDPTGALAFLFPGTLGLAYHPGVWHAGITVIDAEASFAVMMWRGSDDDDVFASVPPLEVRLAEPGSGGATRG